MPFEIFRSEKSGKYYFRLKATNGQVILASEAYEKKADAEKGIQSVVENAKNDNRFERRESKNGAPYFILKASNGQALGKSEMYSSKRALEKGVQAVKDNVKKVAVKDFTITGDMSVLRDIEFINDGILVEINPGSAPPEAIAELLAELSILYRKAGGSGLNFSLQGVNFNLNELAV